MSGLAALPSPTRMARPASCPQGAAAGPLGLLRLDSPPGNVTTLAALFQLATHPPAAVLARMLGLHITVAVAWQRASAGDWVAYAADVSKRHQ